MIYCIITNEIGNMGGAQLYTLYRSLYLKKLGYKVYIIFTRPSSGFFLKNDFSEINLLHVSFLSKPVAAYMPSKRDAITNDIIAKINKNCAEKIIIETHARDLAIWGEYLSSKLNGKSIIYFLNDEKINRGFYYPGKDFYEFKLKQGSMIGLTPTFLSRVFERKIEINENKYVNIGVSRSNFAKKTIPDISKFKEEIKKYDFVIGTIGRLEKSYIEDLIKGVLKLGNIFPNKKIVLLIAGDSTDKTLKEKLEFKYSPKEGNIKIIFLGYLYPLGDDFFELLDVFVGVGTSVINAISLRCASIVMNSKLHRCNGILGIDTFVFGYSEQTKTFTIEEKLSELFRRIDNIESVKIKGLQLFEKEFEQNNCFSKLDNYIANCEISSYYKFKFNLLSFINDNIFYQLHKLNNILHRIRIV